MAGNVIRLGGLSRPHPPAELRDGAGQLVPAPELAAWMRAVFIDPAGPLANEEHAHLQAAALGALWTDIPAKRQMNRIAATAEQAVFRGAAWVKARQEQQMAEWFGGMPDFVITVDANIAAELDDAGFCALVEHELYHCAQARDEFGAPRFSRLGRPVFAMRGHDVEEFVGVVARYGVGAAAGKTAELVQAANKAPIIAQARIHVACGTCGRKVA